MNVTSSYSEKVPGKFALYVEAGEFNKVIHPRGLQCAAHSYPLNISEGFRSSARITLANLVESVEFVDVPMSIDVLRAQGYRGQIVVKGEGLESKLVAIPGFWQANISTTVVLTASVSVDGPQGRVVGRTVEGAAERETEAGPFCSGGAASVEEASGQAMRKLLVQIGEAVANSDKLRHPGRA